MSDPTADQAHDAYRELLSARLDGALEMADEERLTAHLHDCSRCRQVAHDYLDQRRLLRALPGAIPPRDLWARTSAALDRELLRDARRTPRSSGHRQGSLGRLATPGSVPSILLVSAASVTLATVLLVTQLGPQLRLPEIGAPQSTPGVGGVALAFVDANAGGLTLYRTRVDEGCPNAGECPGQDAVEARVTFPASFQPSTLALAPRGDRLAIMGSDNERDNVFAIMNVPPLDGSAPAGDAPSRPRPHGPQASPTSTAVSPGSSVVVVPAGAGGAIPTELAVSTILDGVLGVGAAPAWSADGNALAFSAMPSDRSTGPDIYVWQVGDALARPITNDHRSYFASWSGNAIIVSRVDAAVDELFAATPVVTTLAINLATREQRTVRGPALWLPQVDPTGQRAVGWHGQLAWDGAQVVTVHGALYLVDWASINPFGAAAPAATPPLDAVDVSHGGNPMAGATPSVGAPTPTATSTPAAPTAAATPSPAPRAPIASDAPPASRDALLTPIEPNRDPLQHPVTEWRVTWSDDGRLLAEWIGDQTDSVWGELSVLSIGASGSLADAPLLAATPAKLGFTLANNRVAWVAPTDTSPSGELRLRVWGAAGVHDVRVTPQDTTGVVAAF